ncbi:TetR family transcriptional regulator [Clostridium beijerinckii]|uniref:TetR/AcrR family transcriptional regulator n=1 Tax=Clostridium beijerinckii TaxID=1520 RepID=A0AAW3WDJ7_CLOBE|nr:TetR/AcrR family transcriptional regulator [Clostridium beijerinckii]MBC2476609.1 TetR/AcrR family transcriptional regulator [Clostridium beijerinckii]NOV60061.1 AcrR family transcriptional regulator [Clostridium beijerinckii]NOV71161.1 AcrR family transcriptional regulator [Clostridium beijerinckii]NOW34081.1 AcrR family transcriptional regulator [Clostridium beijerinckii]
MEIKEKILKSSIKLFMENGFFEVSIRDIFKQININKSAFYKYFKSKDELIYKVIEEFCSPYFDEIIGTTNLCNESAKKKLKTIFIKYCGIIPYLKKILNINTFNYIAVTFITIEGLKSYENRNLVNDFNHRLLEGIDNVVEEGKELGEILPEIDSLSTSKSIVSMLQSSMVLWAMNQNIDINLLFKTNFKYLWKSIGVSPI